MLKKEGLQSTVEKVEIGGKFYAQKTATADGMQELVEQVELFNALPPELAIHYPKLVEADLSSDPAHYTMDFYPYPTVRHLLIDSDKDAAFINTRLYIVSEFLTKRQHEWRKAAVPDSYIEKKYLDRVRKRLEKMRQKDDQFGQLLDGQRLYLGNTEFLNPLVMVDAIERDKKVMKMLAPTSVCSTHGQMEFGHILVDEKDQNNFILLDPRGMDDLLDTHYDFGKLRQCSNGLHDWLEEGLFDFEGITIGTTDSVVESLIFRLPERVAVLQKVNSAIDTLLPDLTNSDPNTFYLRTLFAQAINLLGSVPFCYGFGDFEKGLACYISGTKALNEFIKLAEVKI
jgi:hypothetical protein